MERTFQMGSTLMHQLSLGFATAVSLGVRWRRGCVLLFPFLVFSLAYPFDLFFTVRDDVTSAEMVEAIEEGNIQRRIALLALASFAIVSLVRRQWRGLRINGSLGILITAFLLCAAGSIMWADDRALALRRVGVLMILWLGALAFAQRWSLYDMVLFALFSCGLALLLGLGAEIVLGTFRPLESQYRFAGVMHPNPEGAHCAVLFIAALALATITKRGRYTCLAAALIAFVFLLLTKSRTAATSGILGGVSYWVLVSSRYQKAALTWAVTVLVCFLYFGFGPDVLTYGRNALLLGRGQDEEAIYTLTYRLPIWKACLSFVWDRPLLGYGYDAFWTPEHMLAISASAMRQWIVPHSHSGYLAMILGVGVLGTTLYVLILLAGMAKSITFYRMSRDRTYAFAFAILIWLSLNLLLEVINMHPYVPNFLSIVVLAKLGFTNPVWMQRKRLLRQAQPKVNFSFSGRRNEPLPAGSSRLPKGRKSALSMACHRPVP